MDARFADRHLAAWVASAGLGERDVAVMRSAIEAAAAARTRGPEMAHVDDVDAGGRPARLYRPGGDPHLPVLLWLHGGGWTVGSVASHDRAARRLAAASGIAVLLLEFRLAPENPWPASVDDTVAALRWIAGRPGALGLTPARVAVGGDSAGGTLAALACLRLRDTADPAAPDLQVLAYANSDLAGSYPSMREKAHGFGLDVEDVAFFNRQWVPDESRWSDPDVSPLHADPRGLPPAVVVTAEHDPLRDQGAAYAARLRDAGIAVAERCEPGMVHNFLLLDEVSPSCAAAADRLAADVRAALTG